MIVLAIESAATVALVALIEEDRVLCEYTINDKKTHSQTIMPMLESIKKQLDLNLETIDLIAISSGPGSYTGLRIGSATAKGLAHVLDIPIVGISTIESMAYNISEDNVLICPMLDARRQHVFSGLFEKNEGALKNVIPIDQMSIKSLMEALKLLERPVIFLGDGFEAHEQLIRQSFPNERIVIARPMEFLPRASSLGFLAIEAWKVNGGEDYMTHQPNYYRVSQAEREYEEKHNGNP